MDTRLVARKNQLETWKAIVNDCRTSGMKTKDWLVANNISRDQYYYWFRLLRDKAAQELKDNKEEQTPNQIVKIECDETPVVPISSDIIEVTIGRMNIKIPTHVSSSTIQTILEVAIHAK